MKNRKRTRLDRVFDSRLVKGICCLVLLVYLIVVIRDMHSMPIVEESVSTGEQHAYNWKGKEIPLEVVEGGRYDHVWVK